MDPETKNVINQTLLQIERDIEKVKRLLNGELERVAEVMDRPLRDVFNPKRGQSNLTFRILNENGIVTIRDLLRNRMNILKFRSLGIKGFNYIQGELARFGLTLTN